MAVEGIQNSPTITETPTTSGTSKVLRYAQDDNDSQVDGEFQHSILPTSGELSPSEIRELHARARFFVERLEAQVEELKRLRKNIERSRYGFLPILEHLTAGQQMQLDVYNQSSVSFHVPSEMVVLSVDQFLRGKTSRITFPETRHLT
ncbi:MAG: hypothetical protein HYW48_08695 [Deltaproteobacteria bacterium]|nr:hypothetical protein [Deltaproteobacteria bacterium]